MDVVKRKLLAGILDCLGSGRGQRGHNKTLGGKALTLAAILLRAVGTEAVVIVADDHAEFGAGGRLRNGGVGAYFFWPVIGNDKLLGPRTDEIRSAGGRALLGEQMIGLVQRNQGLGVAREQEDILRIVNTHRLVNG